jgi:hypothetical protein
MNDRKVKRIPKDDYIKRENPLYQAFCYQMSAALELARKIDSDKDFPVSSYVRKFLEEFGRKTA